MKSSAEMLREEMLVVICLDTTIVKGRRTMNGKVAGCRGSERSVFLTRAGGVLSSPPTFYPSSLDGVCVGVGAWSSRLHKCGVSDAT